jgi:5-methylcytosine-specific restriction endonuclease McrA
VLGGTRPNLQAIQTVCKNKTTPLQKQATTQVGAFAKKRLDTLALDDLQVL